ncbi:hypothetical protein [Neoroseomonas lacus]|uniref:Uncharacterized protein n=1 Tax=Neoroseomonas lacus TaxID=287609 RepID=A0A917K720_9PROT|nr:hypothetical protein [Neoroseomonas lacus]GGJ00381.1 hypothetical protein GCM10011320_04000 [Neoroseomonas lacus]
MPDGFRPLLTHAPGTFAGYGLPREAAMGAPNTGGALDLNIKDLALTLLDVQGGAEVHAANALRQGLTLPELAEGLVRCIPVGGITTWNCVGRQIMEHAVVIAGGSCRRAWLTTGSTARRTVWRAGLAGRPRAKQRLCSLAGYQT